MIHYPHDLEGTFPEYSCADFEAHFPCWPSHANDCEMNDHDFEQPWSSSLPLSLMSRVEGFELRDLDRESEFPQDNYREKARTEAC